MKTSVYVPDDLWATVTSTDPDVSVSQLVQQLLRDKVDAEAKRPPYATLPPELEKRLLTAQTTAREKVAAAYQLGYTFGLEFASGLQTNVYLVLVASSYDFGHFRKVTEDYEIPLQDEPGQAFDFFEHWTRTSQDLGVEAIFDNDIADLPPVVRQGVLDAVRDVWEGAGLAGVPAPATELPRSLRIVPAKKANSTVAEKRD